MERGGWTVRAVGSSLEDPLARELTWTSLAHHSCQILVLPRLDVSCMMMMTMSLGVSLVALRAVNPAVRNALPSRFADPLGARTVLA